MAANTNEAVNEAAAGQSANIAIDSIRFAEQLSGSTIELAAGELSISDSVVVSAGDGITIDAGGTSRVLNVASGSDEVVLESLTFRNGLAESGGGIFVGSGTLLALQNVSLLENIATGDGAAQGGGGLYADSASVVMTGGSIRGNAASGVSGSGGGVFNAGGTMSLRDVELVGNVANRAGGAIEQAGGDADLTLNSVRFVENVAGPNGSASPGNGGALHISGSGDASLFDATVERNTAASEGGGLWNGTGRLTVIGSTISDNIASGDASDNGGGGIFNNGGTLSVFNTDIRGNAADGDAGSGGGVFSTAGLVTVDASTIQSNVANRAGGGIEIGIGELVLTQVALGGTGGAGNIAGPMGSAAPGNGGGLHVTGDGGATLTRIVITGGVVQGNVAASEGGGLWNQVGSRMSVSGGTRIGGNRAGGETNTEGGGGVFNNGGVVSLTGVTVSNNAAIGTAGGGGGIAGDGGSISVADSMVTGNFALGESGSGGGFLNLNGGRLFVSRTEISGNVASRAGGGIEDASDAAGLLAVTLDEVILTDNVAGVTDEDATAASPGNGGGIHITGQSDLLIRNSEVTENLAAREGGGLWNGTGTMTVESTLIRFNTAFGDAADDGGGGVFNNGGTVILSDSVVADNNASGTSGSGGGIFNLNGTLEIAATDISSNLANRAGGGIEQAGDAFLTLTDVDLVGNVAGPEGAAAPGNGGGLHISGSGGARIVGGLVESNVAAREGGGLWNGTGSMAIEGVTINANVARGDAGDDGGGGLFNNGGDLFVSETTLSGNLANGHSGSGGGLLSLGGAVLLVNSTLEFNGANRAGGGIEVVDGSVALVDTNLINNDVDGTLTGGAAAPGNGGGLHVTGDADVTLDGGVVFGNFAASEGGGLWNQAGATMTITNALIQSNTALGDAADNGGGGIFNNGGTLVVEFSDVIENFADGESGSGGGILNVSGGTVAISDSVVAGNVASRAGGGIEDAARADGVFGTEPTLTLVDTFLEDNNAGVLDDGLGGGALFSTPGNGGGIHVTGPGNVSITGGSVTGNIAANEGGGVWNSSTGVMSITGTTIENNSANGDQATNGGGGIFNDGGSVTVSGGSISSNVATGASGSGGGIFNAGDLSIDSTVISGNVANRAGGGIEAVPMSWTSLTDVNLDHNIAGPAGFAAPGNGGGLHITGSGDASIMGGTVSGNFAAAEGGGLWNGTGTMTIGGGVVISENVAAGTLADQGGGGVFNAGGTVHISEASIIDNVAAAATTFELGGDQEVPPVSTAAVGNATLVFDAQNEQFDLDLFVDGIELVDASELPELIGAHIHLGDAGNNGNVIVNLGIDQWVTEKDGIRLRLTDVEFPAEHLEALANDGTYINVHTTANMSGEIRGQVAFPSPLGSGGGILSDGGEINVSDSTIAGNSASRAGGGIEATAGSSVVLSNVNLDENVAGPSGFATPGNGGGLHLTGDADATIRGGIVSNNFAAREGGGLWNGSGTMTIDGTTVLGNIASGAAADDGGGGLFNNGGDLSISGSLISGNTADGASGSGGGLLSLAGNISITETTFEFNGANRAGGGIEVIDGILSMTDSDLINNDVDGTLTGGVASPGNGGGLHVTGIADVAITDGTVFGNVAASEGGGLWNQAGSTMSIVGTLVEGNSAFGDAADNGGGGIFNNGGTLVVSNASISGNFADGQRGSGGGILNVSGGTVEVVDSTISRNVASRAGGGIEDASEADGVDVIGPSLILTGVTLAENNAGVLDDGDGGGALFSTPGNGGGLHVTGSSDVSIVGGRIEANLAASEGGGLWNGTGRMTVDGTTIAGNSASGDESDNGGGGVFNSGGEIELSAVTISDNVADGAAGSGGGIFNDGGELRLKNTTLLGNIANRAGGGIEQAGDNAFLDLDAVTFESNVAGPVGAAAPGNGGGLHLGDASDGFIRDSVFRANTAARDGGGIWNGAGSLTVIDTSVLNNVALGSEVGQGGGGIYNLGTLTFSRGEISENESVVGSGNGGGLLNARFANGSINDTSIVGNVAARAGGGIENEGNLLVGQSMLTGNAAGINGGGLHITGFGVAIFTGSTISENSADNEGGGLWNSADGLIAVQTSLVSANTAIDGAGVFNDGDDGDVRLVNTTLSGNVADGSGGGLRSEGGEVLMTSVTITNNTAMAGGGVDIVSGIATLSSSIVGGNSAATAPDIRGQVISEGFNVIGDTSGAVLVGTDATDQLDEDPRLAALSDNGGDTQTHALLADSPALDAGDPDGVPADQRLVSRPLGPASDSGAFESELPSSGLPAESAEDVNGDGLVSPLDALMVINYLARSGLSQSAAEGEFVPQIGRLDVNRDSVVSPVDALRVINRLARDQSTAAAGVGQANAVIDSVLRDQIEKRRDEIDELLIEQLAIEATAKIRD